MRQPSKIILTFDVEGPPPREDYFCDSSAFCMKSVLDLLERNSFRGIFFITGSVAEKLRKYPRLAKRLSRHTIGYHSSVHYAQMGILRFTDVQSYSEAVSISIKRETSRINLENGKIQGKDGLLTLNEVFPLNNVECFRAPFFGWSPPHLEALKKLGIKFDFSTHISDSPFFFKGVVFYPIPISIDTLSSTVVRRENNEILIRTLMSILLQRKLVVLSLHPSMLLVNNCFDKNRRQSPRGKAMIKLAILMLRLLFKQIKLLEKLGVLQVTTRLNGNFEHLNPRKVDVKKIYLQSIHTPVELFGYHPKHVFSHFSHFFSSNEKPDPNARN